MNFDQFLKEIDAEISKLQSVRRILLSERGAAPKAHRGLQSKPVTPTAKRRKMSPEAKEKIRQAQLKRWAKAKNRKR